MTADSFVLMHLKNLPLFQRCTPAQLALVAPLVETFRVYPNEYIFRQGQSSRGMYVLVEGRAVLTQLMSDGSERIAAEMHAYQYVGDAALFAAGTERLSLKVVETALVLFLARERFSALLAQHPELKLRLAAPAVAAAPSAKLFRDQRPDERVVQMVRRHWWVIVARSVIPTVIAIALWFVGLLLGTGLELVVWGGSLALLSAWLVFMYLDWRNDYVIVTDQRIVFVEVMLLRFQTNIRDTPVGSIQEVNYEIPPDPFARLFNYGRLNISTAGGAGRVVLDFVPNPRAIQQVVIATRRAETETARQQTKSAIDARLDQVFSKDDTRANAPPTIAGGTTSRQPSAAVPPTEQRSGWLATRMIGPNGEIIYRKHLSVWALHVMWPALVIAGALGLMFMSLFFLGRGVLGLLELAAGVFMLVVGAVWFYLADWDWRNDYYILGSDTISIIHKRPLWLRDERDEILITQIDNVISKKVGLTDSLLNRGDVRVVLTGDDPGQGKVLQHVHRPEHVQAEISQLRTAALARARP
ncbi:MAG: cyclic nucleotide-binding domain-containing protein [Aggregatilineales bacterium]